MPLFCQVLALQCSPKLLFSNSLLTHESKNNKNVLKSSFVGIVEAIIASAIFLFCICQLAAFSVIYKGTTVNQDGRPNWIEPHVFCVLLQCTDQLSLYCSAFWKQTSIHILNQNQHIISYQQQGSSLIKTQHGLLTTIHFSLHMRLDLLNEWPNKHCLRSVCRLD